MENKESRQRPIDSQSEKVQLKIEQIEALPIPLSQKAYLKCIAKLTSSKQWIRQKEIADSLGYSKASVSVAIKQLRSAGYIIDESGYIKVNDDKLDEYGKLYKSGQSGEMRSMVAKIEELPISLSQKEYLKYIAKLNEVKRIVRRIDIAEALRISKASVTVAINQLIPTGYILEEDGCLKLNDLMIAGYEDETNNGQKEDKTEKEYKWPDHLEIANREKEKTVQEKQMESNLETNTQSIPSDSLDSAVNCSESYDAIIDSLSISDSYKTYMKCIIDLKNKVGSVRQKDIASALGYTSASVSVAVNQLQEMGFVTIDHGDVSLNDLTAFNEGELIFKQVTGIQKRYLYSIAKLTENGAKVRKSEIASDMGYSRAAVSIALKKMQQDDLVRVDDGYVKLNDLIDLRVREEMRCDAKPEDDRKPLPEREAISEKEMRSKKVLPAGKEKAAGAEYETEYALPASNSDRWIIIDTPASPSELPQIATNQTTMTDNSVDEMVDGELPRDDENPRTKPVAYTGSDNYILVSYSHRDTDKVYPFISDMISDGLRVWYDEGIEPGTGWDDNLALHIENSEMMIAVISHNYLESENCRDELNFARDLGKKTIIVYLEKTDLPPGLRLRFNRVYALHRYEMEKKDFFRKLYSVDRIEAVRDPDRL